EMAIILPLLVLLLIGIFSTARAWQVHNTMDHAVREAARHGATVDPWTDPASQDDIFSVAQKQLEAAAIVGVQKDCIGKGPTPCGAAPISGTDQVVVRIKYPNYKLDFVFF